MGTPTLALWPSKDVYNEGRAYKNPFTGEKLASVTTILKMADKSGLAQWAANLTFEWCNTNWALLGSRSTEDAKRAASYQWKKVRDERAEVGTGVHETVESIHTGSAAPFLNEEQERMMDRFHEFDFAHSVKPVYTEFTVWSPGNYAGTGDGIWLIDGELWLIDVKTSKNTWPEHFAQLAALATAEFALVRVPEGTEDAVKHEDNKGNISWWIQIPNPGLQCAKVGILHLREDFWKLIEVEDIEIHKEVFNGYKDVWNAKAKLKAITSAKEKLEKDLQKQLDSSTVETNKEEATL